jgi:hypothetical protein
MASSLRSILVGLLLAPSLFSSVAEARVFGLGLSAGGNFSYLQWSQPVSFQGLGMGGASFPVYSDFDISGWGYFLGGAVSVFPDSWIGLRANLDLFRLNLFGDPGFNRSYALLGELLLTVQFTIAGGRHSLGFGPVFSSQFGVQSNPSGVATIEKLPLSSYVIEGKNWLGAAARGLYLIGKVLILPTSWPYSGTELSAGLGLGYDI